MSTIRLVPRKPKSQADLDRGARIRQSYEMAGLNRAALAERIGRYYHDVIRLEGGQKPDPETLVRICGVTGVSERWLLRGPVYSEPFKAWLANEAPQDLHDIEREVLGSISFPGDHDPGASWYSLALSAWRMGTGSSLISGTHVRRAAPKAVPPATVAATPIERGRK